MRILVRAPGQTFKDVLTAVQSCDGTILFSNRKKAMMMIDASEKCLGAIRQAGGETWTDDRDVSDRAY